MTRAVLVAHRSVGSPRVVLTLDEHPGLHWGAGLGLPGGVVLPTDRPAPGTRGARGEQPAAEVTALRGLFVATGVLVAEGAALLSADDRGALRETMAHDPGRGAARLAALGIRWDTERVETLTRRRASGDALREDVVVCALALDDAEAAQAGAQEATHCLARWSVGALALADFVPALLRRLAADELDHVGLDADDALEPAPGIRMLPVRSPTLPPAAHTNIFLVGGRTAVLIEPATPFPDELDRICRWVEDAEAEGTIVLASAPPTTTQTTSGGPSRCKSAWACRSGRTPRPPKRCRARWRLTTCS
jgi:hypothetical protein